MRKGFNSALNVEIGNLADAEDWQLLGGPATEELLGETAYTRCFTKYAHLRGKKLLQDVYRRYPYYAIKSERAAKIMNENELRAIEAARPCPSSACLFTIGYEGSSLEGYLNRLIRNGVKTLVDVRRNPLSRKFGFSKKTLSDTAKKLGVGYVHMPELGMRRTDAKN